MTTPTLINLPPPPSDPATPSDMGPGTPNSSLSALSTVAIKDGHQGHPGHRHHSHTHSTDSNTSTATLDAERADRISRLAGLERVSTVRQGNQPPSLAAGPGLVGSAQSMGYFDNAPPHIKERSTVGSASATGSVGGRTTWASGSDVYDPDKMSEDQDDGVSSVGGFSDEGNASLVGFGEAASSTLSGPISTTPTTTSKAQTGGRSGVGGSPIVGKGSLLPSYTPQHQGGSPMVGVVQSPFPQLDSRNTEAKLIDGVTYDANVVDTTMRSARLVQDGTNVSGPGIEAAERIMSEQFRDGEIGRQPMGPSDDHGQGLGKFVFEEK